MGSETYTTSSVAAMASLAEKLRQHALPIFKHTTEDRYTDSFGTRLNDIGDRCRWKLSGSALEEWNNHLFPLLEEVMENGQTTIYKGENVADCHIFRLCYMLGCDEQHAYPTVVIACNGKRFRGILKRTMRLITDVREFAQKGFRVLGLRVSDLDFKVGLGNGFARISGIADYESSSRPISLCGRQIRVNKTQREAIIGGTIIADDAYYALTVAHVFLDSDIVDSTTQKNPKMEIFTSDWALQSDDDDDDDDDDEEEEEDDDLTYDSGHASAESESSQETPTARTDASINVASSSQPSATEIPLVSYNDSGEVGRSDGLRVCYSNTSRDWAIMNLHNHKFFGANEAPLPSAEVEDKCVWAYLHEVSLSPPQGEVIILYQDVILKANGTGAAVSGKLKNSQSFNTMWSVTTHETLPNGICGSWAFDGKTHDILGPVAAGSGLLGETFIIPMDCVLESVRKEMNASQTRFPTRTDSLWLSVYFNNRAMCKRLLDCPDADLQATPKVPIQNPEFSRYKADQISMLHWSAMQGYLEISQMLIQAGADVNAKTASLKTPLHLAAFLDATTSAASESKRTKQNIVRLLLDQEGIQINARDQDEKTPLMMAETSGFQAATKMIEAHVDSKEFDESLYYPSPSITTDNETPDDEEPSNHGETDISGPDHAVDPIREWIWHPEAQNYYLRILDDVGWVTIWARRRDSVAQGPARESNSAGGDELENEIPTAFSTEVIRGDPQRGSYEPLDPTYKIVESPRRFFRVGRMFSVLYTEPLGATISGMDDDNVSLVMYGERVYTNVRRFIVVREGRGFCYACPVSTYGGRGTGKRGLDPSTHAIVYTTDADPRYISGEMELRIPPIPVEPVDASVRLSPASRINFALHHPIQHNVKVKNLGTVPQDYIPVLVQYARSESGF